MVDFWTSSLSDCMVAQNRSNEIVLEVLITDIMIFDMFIVQSWELSNKWQDYSTKKNFDPL